MDTFIASASQKGLRKSHGGWEKIREPYYKSVQFAFHWFRRCPENFVQHAESRWTNETWRN